MLARRRVSLFQRQGVCEAAFHPDGRRLVTAGREVGIWDLASGARLRGWQAHPAEGASLFIQLWLHPDGERLITSDGASETVLWRLDTGAPLLRTAGVLRCLLDGGRGAFVERDEVVVRELDRGAALARCAVRKKLSPSYHPLQERMSEEEIDAHTPSAGIEVVAPFAGGRLAIGSMVEGTELLDVERGAQSPLATGRLVCVLPGDRLLAAGARTLELWDLGSGRLAGELPLQSRTHLDLLVALHPDGRRLLACARSALRCFDLQTGATLLARDCGAHGAPDRLRCHPAGGHALLQVSGSGEVLAWDLQDDRIAVLRAPEGAPARLGDAALPTGETLCFTAREVLAWDVPGARITGRWDSGLRRISRVACGPTGAIAAWDADQWGVDAGLALLLP